MFGFIKNPLYKKPTVERPSSILSSVTDKELLMVVSTYGYATYKEIKEDQEIYRTMYSTNLSLDSAIDRIMANRVIKELEVS